MFKITNIYLIFHLPIVSDAHSTLNISTLRRDFSFLNSVNATQSCRFKTMMLKQFKACSLSPFYFPAKILPTPKKAPTAENQVETAFNQF